MLADPDDLEKAAQILSDGKKIAILAGRGALQATAELEQLAEVLGAPIVKALLGRAVVPVDSAYTTETIGLLGTKPSQEAMETCDTLLMVGTSFPYLEFLPQPGHAKGVQIEIDPKRIGLRFPVEVGLVGDCRRILRDLLPRLERKENRSFLDEIDSSDVVAGERDLLAEADFMTAPSSELWRPSSALRKGRLQSLACGFLQRHPCLLYQNEGFLSFRGEPRFQLTCRLLCRTCDHSISYVNQCFFGLPFHPPRYTFAARDPLPATRNYDAVKKTCVAGENPFCSKNHVRFIRGRTSLP
jgi:hypothetical protein